MLSLCHPDSSCFLVTDIKIEVFGNKATNKKQKNLEKKGAHYYEKKKTLEIINLGFL